MSIDMARAVADAVLWEGYLLYPYRANSAKNQIRWQFGVLGPPKVARSGIAEDPAMHCQCLLRVSADTRVQITVRFLHLVRRQLEQFTDGNYTPVDSMVAGGVTLLSFDEADARELSFGPFDLAELRAGRTLAVTVPASVESEQLTDLTSTAARIVRSRRALTGTLQVTVVDPTVSGAAGTVQLRCALRNTDPDLVSDPATASAVSFIGAHLLLQTVAGTFVSLLDPPAADEAAAKACRQSRCWPVLAGAPGDTDVMLASPIILYDYPAVAPESAGALFDSTEIDEILTLRVMTLTDEEKAAARATDPAAAAIIDRCNAMSPQTLARLHGALRNPHAFDDAGAFDGAGAFDDVPTFGTPSTPDAPWWDPGVDASVSPTTDSLMIAGVPVAKGSLVRLHPSRRADAQDLFYAGQQARVTAVYSDVDDNSHVAVVLTDDPAADLHEWYGRFLYFAPDELEPLDPARPDHASAHRGESREPSYDIREKKS